MQDKSSPKPDGSIDRGLTPPSSAKSPPPPPRPKKD